MKRIFLQVSSGLGQRLDKTIHQKKQYYKFNDIPSFIYPLKTALNSNIFNFIILVINKDDYLLTTNYLKKYNLREKVLITYGGDTRTASVYNGLKLIKNLNLKDEINVFIHDGARILLSKELIFKLNKFYLNEGIIIPFIPIYDSLYSFKENNYVERSEIISLQTPQVCNFNYLYSLFRKIENSNLSFKDEGSIIKYFQGPLVFVNGQLTNYKLTDASSLNLIRKLIKWVTKLKSIM